MIGVTMEAVIYCRVSTRFQAENGYSLGFQLADCLQYCADQGWHIAAVFSEVGSGDARSPKLLPARHQAVVTAIKRKAVLVCTLPDRLTRERLEDFPYYKQVEFGKLKVCFAWNHSEKISDEDEVILSRKAGDRV